MKNVCCSLSLAATAPHQPPHLFRLPLVLLVSCIDKYVSASEFKVKIYSSVGASQTLRFCTVIKYVCHQCTKFEWLSCIALKAIEMYFLSCLCVTNFLQSRQLFIFTPGFGLYFNCFSS